MWPSLNWLSSKSSKTSDKSTSNFKKSRKCPSSLKKRSNSLNIRGSTTKSWKLRDSKVPNARSKTVMTRVVLKFRQAIAIQVAASHPPNRLLTPLLRPIISNKALLQNWYSRLTSRRLKKRWSLRKVKRSNHRLLSQKQIRSNWSLRIRTRESCRLYKSLRTSKSLLIATTRPVTPSCTFRTTHLLKFAQITTKWIWCNNNWPE